MEELTNAQLSMLWLLRDVHTTKQAVEKAILNELPLWPDAIRMARAYHRSKKDLAGGKYYIIGSEWIEDEWNSPYSYHELGRYPINKRKNASVSRKLSPESSERESRSTGVRKDQLFSTSSVHTQFPSGSDSLKEKEAVCDQIESDRSKQLGGTAGASTELDHLQLDRNLSDVYRISDDGSSECEAGDADVTRLTLAPQGRNTATGSLPHKSAPKESAASRDPAISVDPKRSEKRRPASPVKKPIFDYSVFEPEIRRQCELLIEPRPIRSFSHFYTPEEFREKWLKEQEELLGKGKENSTSGNSEMEDVEAAVLAEFDKADEELEQAIMSGEVMKAGEEMNRGEPMPQNASNPDKEKAKRRYVYPFDDSSSVICSDFSDDDNIGTNIFMEISEHRRVEGASSPSSCSDDSNYVLPPNVFVWLPQTLTYDINLVTHFRSPSPSAKYDIVIPIFEKESIEMGTSEPKRATVTSLFTYSKNPCHSGAFARKRGARMGSPTSFACEASTSKMTSIDCDISSSCWTSDYCEIELFEHVKEHASITCKASKDVVSSVARVFSSHPSNNETYEAVLAEHLSEHVAFTCREPKRATVTSLFSYSKNPCHSGAFARKRGARMGSPTSFACEASTNKMTSIDCDMSSSCSTSDYCQIELFEHVKEHATIACKASEDVVSSVACVFSNHLSNNETYEAVLAEQLSEHVALTCRESTFEEVVSSLSFESTSFNKDCTVILPTSLQESASLDCRAPKLHDIRSLDKLNAKSEIIEDTLQILPTLTFASTSLSCSAPRCETVTSSWIFEIQIGNGTSVTIRDKVQSKVAMHCKASAYCDLTRRPLSNRLPIRSSKLHDATMEECLLLLELGAMPSQSIDVDPCPQNSPCSSTSSTKGNTKTRRRDSKRIASSESAQSHAVNLNEVSAALTTGYEKPTTRHSAAETMSSQRSDHSGSPDRLVIVEDLEGVIMKDPPLDEMPVREEAVVKRRSSTRAAPSSTVRSSPSVILELEGNSSTKSSCGSVSRKSLRKRGPEPFAADTVVTQAKRRKGRASATFENTHSSPLSDTLSVEAECHTGAEMRTENVHRVVSRTKSELRISDEKTSVPSTSTGQTASSRNKSKHSATTTDRKRLRNSRSPELKHLTKTLTTALPRFRSPVVFERDAHPTTSQLSNNSITTPLMPQKTMGSEVAVMKSMRGPKANNAITPCKTAVLPPTKIYPKPVSELSVLSLGVDSVVQVPTRSGSGNVGSAKVSQSPLLSTKESRQLESHSPNRYVEISAAFNPKTRLRSCVSVSILTEEFEVVEATFKECRTKVGVNHNLSPIAKQKHIDADEISGVSAPWDVKNSSADTHTSAPITRRKGTNLLSEDYGIVTASRACLVSTDATSSKLLAPSQAVTSASPETPVPISVVLSQTGSSLENGKLSATQASTISTRCRTPQVVNVRKRRPTQAQASPNKKARCASSDIMDSLEGTIKERIPPSVSTNHDLQRRSGRLKRSPEANESPVVQKRRKTSVAESKSCVPAPSDHDTSQSVREEPQTASSRRKSSRFATQAETTTPATSNDGNHMSSAPSSSPASSITTNDDVVIIDSASTCRRRRKSSSPPILVVAVELIASFVPTKRDNKRSAEPITLWTCNFAEVSTTAIFSSDSAEILNALALEIITSEASTLSTVNMATFAQFVFNLFDPVSPIFGKLSNIEPSTLPANFTTIFELASPLQFRHRLDYSSFNTMLMNRLPESGLHALTLDSRKVSMLKITKFVDTIKESVAEICEELRTRRTLSKGEIQTEKDLSSEVQHLITSRYVETMMKLADACHKAPNVPAQVIADRFHLLLCGWNCFLQQGGALRVRLQLSPMRSHPGIVDVTTAWLDQIDGVLSRAQATLSTRTSAFAVSLAQEKNVMKKIWQKMASQTSPTCKDGSYIHCAECNLYFHNEDTDFMHNRILHQKSRECEECYDMFHTLLGLDLHMVGCHKRSFVSKL
ncbi:hypothetical protein GCK32_004650 [Trichostrongylus colubriformis]|uniref:C2H2-type domain-containing protein n=1 Tax=Trichostrongylus colubriformis TaxID=6319 RepID=A0AAN8F9T2_TRICO